MKYYHFLTILMFKCSPIGAQVFPVITDYPSLEGSNAAVTQYLLLKRIESDNKGEVVNFNGKYSKRNAYLLAPLTLTLSNEIDSELTKVSARCINLKTRNNSMGIYHYSLKRRNEKYLWIIEQMIANLKRGLDNQRETNTVLGEKMILYQNAMASMTKIHRQLDGVEDKMDRALLINKILGRY